MSKLLSMLVAAVFATVSLSALAASHTGAMKDDKAAMEKKEVKKDEMKKDEMKTEKKATEKKAAKKKVAKKEAKAEEKKDEMKKDEAKKEAFLPFALKGRAVRPAFLFGPSDSCAGRRPHDGDDRSVGAGLCGSGPLWERACPRFAG